MITMRLQHKDGKIIDAPKAGVAALLALGWERVDPPQEPPETGGDGGEDGAAAPEAGGDETTDAAESEDGAAAPEAGGDETTDAAESEDGAAKAKPAAKKRGSRRQVPKPGDDA